MDAPVLSLKEAAEILNAMGVSRTGQREANRVLVYDLQAAADGLDHDQLDTLLDHLTRTTDPVGVLRLVTEGRR